MPASSLFLINPLGDLLEICCKSKMSRYSSKISDHAHKTSIQSADPLATLREVIFCTYFRSGLVIRSGFSNLHFQNLLPALPCPPRRSYRRALCFAGTSIPFFPAHPGQLPLGVASTPLNPRGHALEKSRPLSRVLSWTVIPLGCASPRSSSDLPGSLTWTTWCGRHAPRASLFGLAPGGVCRAADVATRAVRSYRTISPLPVPLAQHLGGIFLLHFPWAHAPQALPGTVPYGARTFLHPLQLALTRTATAWPTLGGHHTQIWLRMRGGLLFEVQGALVGLVVTSPCDLRGQPRRLLEGQFRQQNLERAVERAVMTVGAAIIIGGRLRPGENQHDFTAAEIGIHVGACEKIAQRSAIRGFMHLGDFARHHGATLAAENRRAIFQRFAHTMPRFIQHQGARL